MRYWTQILQRVSRDLPGEVITVLLKSQDVGGDRDNQLKNIAVDVLSKNNDLIPLILDFVERELLNFKNASSFSVKDSEEQDAPQSKFEWDRLCVANTATQDFLLGHYPILEFWVNVLISILEHSSDDKFRRTVQIYQERNFQTIHRIVLVSTIKHNYFDILFDYYSDPDAYLADTLSFYLVNNLGIFLENSKDNNEKVFDTILIAARKKREISEEYAARFLVHINNSVNGFSISIPKDLRSEIEIAKGVLSELFSTKTQETEVIMAELKPELSGIRPFERLGPHFSQESFSGLSTKERIEFLKKSGPGRTDGIEYWWVESGRVLQRLFEMNPMEYLEIAKTLMTEEELFPFRSFIVRALQNREKIEKKSEIAIVEEVEIVKMLIKSFEIDYTPNPDEDNPVCEFVEWVHYRYHLVPENERPWIRKQIDAISSELSIQEEKKHSGPSDALDTAINTITGKTIEALSSILAKESEANSEKEQYQRLATEFPQSTQCLAAQNLSALKRHHGTLAKELLNKWTEEENILALSLCFSYFKVEDQSLFLGLLQKWKPLFQKELESKIEHSDLSFTLQAYNILVFFCDQGVDAAQAFANTEFNEITPGQGVILARLILYYYPEKLQNNESFRVWAFQLCDHSAPEVREEVIKNLPLKDESSQFYRTLQRDMIERTLKQGRMNGWHPYYSFAQKLLPDFGSEDYEWSLRVISLFLEQVEDGHYVDLQPVAGVLMQAYLDKPLLRDDSIKLIGEVINRGWQGLDVLYNLGRR